MTMKYRLPLAYLGALALPAISARMVLAQTYSVKHKGDLMTLRFLVAVLLAILPLTSQAQAWPAKPLRFITESAPGAIIDVAMRAATPDLSNRLGQPVVLENRTGANGIVATEACIKAAPDGYTGCVVSANTMSFNPNVFASLPYDPQRDLKAVARLLFLNSALTVSASLPVNSVNELRQLAVSKPGALNFGTLGAGTQTDVFRQYLVESWMAEMVGIPYKSGNLVVNALVAGEVNVGMFALGSVAGQLKSGKARLLAIGAERRQKQFPDVPLLKEFNLDEGNSRVFWGLMVTAATPDAIVNRLNADLVRTFQDAKLLSFLEGRFLEPALTTAEEFATFLAADRAHVGRLVKKFNVPVQ